MASLRQLIQGTQKVHPKAIQWAPDGNNKPLLSLEVQKFKGVNSIMVYTTQKMSGRWPKGERPTSRKGVYKQTMRFTLQKEGRKDVNKFKPKISTDKCNVNCGCDNYYYMWWWGNRKVKAHEGGNYKQYVRKTPPPPEGRPEVNPQNIPGVCKHIVYVMKELKRKKVIQ
jgi:hypothetical protein